MQSSVEEQEIIVRGTEKHKDYLRYQFGRIKDTVNGFETRIAVSGRAMLLLYVVYITVKAGVGNSLPANMPAWVSTSLVILDIVMLALQVLGLEGSVPGLRHLAEELEDKGKYKEAKTVRAASNIAQWLLAATAIDIVLQRNAIAWGIADFANGYTNCLFVLRVVVIGFYLVAMAKLEHKGPKIISQYEAAKQTEEKEQEQIRIDNANIRDVVNQAIIKWASTQPDMDAMFSDSIKRLESVVAQRIDSMQATQNERISTLSRSLEAAQFGSNIGSSVDTESLMLQVEMMLSRSNAELMQAFEIKIADVSRQVSRVETSTTNQIGNLRLESTKALAEAEARNNEALKKIAVEAKASAIQKNAVKEPAKPRQAQITDITEAREERQGGLSVEELKLLFESDESLLKLSGSMLAQKYGTSKASANRAKKEYFESHPESLNNLDSGELAAISM